VQPPQEQQQKHQLLAGQTSEQAVPQELLLLSSLQPPQQQLAGHAVLQEPPVQQLYKQLQQLLLAGQLTWLGWWRMHWSGAGVCDQMLLGESLSSIKRVSWCLTERKMCLC
jgi:hypothetical protein